MKRLKITLGLLAYSTVLFAQKKNEIDLYYLGGQSNMDGYGYIKDLPDSLKNVQDGVYIFHGNTVADDEIGGGVGSWQVLKPGHGVGFGATTKKNNYSDRFGVELSFAKRIQELRPGRSIAIIKYSRGGTAIDSAAINHFGCWDPDYNGKTGINQYDQFLATVKNAMADGDIDDDRVQDVLIPRGILWMQGESDANPEAVALRYEENLKRLMDLVRATFWTDDLPVVIGKISDSHHERYDGLVWKYGDYVRQAQENYVKKDGRAAIVRQTETYQYSDPWHYQSDNYVQLGIAFAEALDGIE
ncbi:sialate O-acetylesterase [Reichenbachiella ulvae]|uniref:Sialate O-acetylesterase n=1 Tax=Reichenbachiella ulvae TaxID=2980104 RepID=A0ABT3CUC1_9BACT|nr:sialate O-acetylesterase [Reichenbachiella ulvae]MCV9386833.1 sialate O-acetylesterase [Reichenbachiella ulvae]